MLKKYSYILLCIYTESLLGARISKTVRELANQARTATAQITPMLPAHLRSVSVLPHKAQSITERINPVNSATSNALQSFLHPTNEALGTIPRVTTSPHKVPNLTISPISGESLVHPENHVQKTKDFLEESSLHTTPIQFQNSHKQKTHILPTIQASENHAFTDTINPIMQTKKFAVSTQSHQPVKDLRKYFERTNTKLPLRQALTKQTQAHKEKLQKLNESHEKTLNDLQAQYDATRQLLVKATANLSSLQINHADLQQKHTDLTTEHSELQKAHNEKKQEHEDLTAMHEDLASRHTTLKARLNELEAENARLTTARPEPTTSTTTTKNPNTLRRFAKKINPFNWYRNYKERRSTSTTTSSNETASQPESIDV